MRFTYAEAMTDPTFYIPLAKAAEAAGEQGLPVGYKKPEGGGRSVASLRRPAIFREVREGERLSS